MSTIYTSIIYLASCVVNNKKYVGFTTNFEERKETHRRNSNKHCCQEIFYKAIRKYGWESFDWKIIYESNNEEICLSIMEPYFIKLYNSLIPNGYNMTPGGDKPPIHYGANNVNFGKMGGRGNPMFGKKHSEETKQKIGKQNKEQLRENFWYNDGIKNYRCLEIEADPTWERKRLNFTVWNKNKVGDPRLRNQYTKHLQR